MFSIVVRVVTVLFIFFFFQAEDGIRDLIVTGVQTCALPICEVTSEIVDALVERGIFRMLLPKSLGGAELDPLTYTAVLEELARGDGSPAWCLGQNSGCSMIAPYLPPETAREVFGGPRGILAWGPDMPGAGRAVAVEGGYRVTGLWGFAPGSRHASWLGCHGSVFEPDGAARLLPNRRPGVRTMA